MHLAVLDRELSRTPHHRGQLGRILDEVCLGQHPEPGTHEHHAHAEDREDDHQLEDGHPALRDSPM